MYILKVYFFFRFMPDGIYLNANVLEEEEMARKMNELIRDKEKYYDYFKWHRYYSYYDATDSADTDPGCAFCAFMNNKTKRSERRVYARFTQWWNDGSKDDPIIWYDRSVPDEKAFYIVRPNAKSVTTSVLQSVGEFVDKLYNFYFDFNK